MCFFLKQYISCEGLNANVNIEPNKNPTPSKFKNQHLNNNPKINSHSARPSYIGKASNVFAAYDKAAKANDNEAYWNASAGQQEGAAGTDGSEKSAQNSKQLPLWLREGLEKIKQEKQKKETNKKEEPKMVSACNFLNIKYEDSKKEESFKIKD